MAEQSFAELVRGDLYHSAGLEAVTSRPLRFVIATRMLLLHPRVRGVLWFRVAQAVWHRPGGHTVGLWLQARVQRLCGAELHPAARIGPGLCLAHSTGVVVGSDVMAGRNLMLHQNATLGGGGERRSGHPVVGDGVVIGAGACVLGPVTIGDGARVGANAVVTRDVPPGATAVGVPARAISGATASDGTP